MTTIDPATRSIADTLHPTIVSLTITKWGRFWAVHDAQEQLVFLTVYKKGAREVVYRLSEILWANGSPVETARTAG